MLSDYAEYSIHHIQLFRDSCEEKGNIIKEDWSNVDCKEFDKFSENLDWKLQLQLLQDLFHIYIYITVV